MKVAMSVFGLLVLLALGNTAVAIAVDGFEAVPEPMSFATVGVAVASLVGYKVYRNKRQ